MKETFPSICDIFYCRKRSPKTKDEPFAFVAPPPVLPSQNKVITTEKDNSALDSVSSSSSTSATGASSVVGATTGHVVKETDNKIPKVELQNPSGQTLPPPPITIVNKDDFTFAEPQTVRTV